MELKLKNLSCSYNSNFIIKNLNCKFNTGEAVALLGANGVGKTTLLKAILRHASSIGGYVCADEEDLFNVNLKKMSELIAYVPQTNVCNYNYTVLEVVMMGLAASLSFFAAPGKNEEEKSINVLHMLNMENYKDRQYNALSGGEQQMVLIARAIVQNSQFILMDEPASNLDYMNQKILIKTIIELKKRGKGIFFITHNPEHALLCCEKVLILMPKGKYVYGDTGEVLTTENLCEAYKTEMQLLEVKDNYGCVLKTCCMKL